MSEQIPPQNQPTDASDELNTEELEDVAGGGPNNGCTIINNSCPVGVEPIDG